VPRVLRRLHPGPPLVPVGAAHRARVHVEVRVAAAAAVDAAVAGVNVNGTAR
jgi:hypothetical protein